MQKTASFWSASVSAACLCVFLAINANGLEPGDGNTTLTVAMVDFVDANNRLNNECEILFLYVLSEISKNDNIRIVERKEMKRVFEEQKISLSFGASSESSIKLGALLGAEYILRGRVYHMGEKLYFNGKLINCLNGEISGTTLSHPEQKDTDAAYKDFSCAISHHITEKLRNSSQGATGKVKSIPKQ